MKGVSSPPEDYVYFKFQVPVHKISVQKRIHEAGYYVDADITDRKIDKKVREAQIAQYNYILVVGESEAATGQVSVRIRDSAAHLVKNIDDLLEEFKPKTASSH
ncbi:unnamed protein product [Thlaspi arvense]|uniref:Anticodon-binding domain-containing protein n=1 Tax=Thlaspi arvense TaxID=13288 RepID=A0AAU9SEK3_THLAR|nr:unnamed protein product [Thlaspi arvense]